jgi:bifunctional ADP-heptose synthase (sugar kinase/adenylyltransferase)
VRSFRDKIKEREELREIVEGLKKDGKRICFTNGCFDIVHEGHVLYLEEARRHGENKPVIPLEGRMTVLAALEVVDYVVPFFEPDPFALISYLRPHVLVKGGDWEEGEVVGRELVEETIVVPYIEGASTSGIIKTILQRYAG